MQIIFHATSDKIRILMQTLTSNSTVQPYINVFRGIDHFADMKVAEQKLSLCSHII